MRSFIVFLSFCIFLLADEAKRSQPVRIVARHIEAGGIGYEEGYSTLEGFFSPLNPIGEVWLPFLDLRGHVFNNGRLAANAGAGVRYLSSRIWGGNAYYDYRRTKRQHYNQVAMGFESLGESWDFRLNGYFPVGKTRSSLWDSRFDYFQGNYAFLSSKMEFAFRGANAEAAAHLYAGKNVEFTFAGGPYYLSGQGDTAWGGEVRVGVGISKYFNMEGRASYDNVFHWTGQGQLSIVIPLGGKSSCSRLHKTQPIERFEIVPVHQKRKISRAIDPSTGEPYFFWFVNNTSHSRGTFESPFSTLVDAQMASSESDVIYVFSGDGTSTGMDAGIQLKNKQSLFGAGTTQQLATTTGTIAIPPQGEGMPHLSAPSGSPVVLVANKNVVSGFQIASNGGGVTNGSFCIGSLSGNTIDLTISNNLLTSNDGAAGIFPNGPSGEITITDNYIQSGDSAGTFGIYLSQTDGFATYDVKNNTVSNFRNLSISPPDVPSAAGIVILVQNESQGRAFVSENQINQCRRHSIDLRCTGTHAPFFYALVNNNQIEGIIGMGTGIFLLTDNHAVGKFDVFNNTSRENTFGLIAQAEGFSSMVGAVSNNTLFGGLFGSGMILETNLLTQSESARGSFTVTSNTIFDFEFQGIATAAHGTSSLDVLIQDNAIHHVSRAGLFLVGSDSSSNTLTVLNNSIHNNNGGMEVDSETNSRVNILVQSNTIFSNNGAGFFSSVQMTGMGTFEILSNTFSDNNLLNLNSGSAVTIIPEDSASVCLRMLNNQSTAEATSPDYFLENVGTGLFNVEPLVGNTGTITQTGTTPVSPGACGSH